MSRAAQINIDWAKIKRDREERERAVFCGPNPDGYKLAVTNKIIGAVYERCKLTFKICGAPGRTERLMWEKNAFAIMQIAYKKMYKYALIYPVKGTWQMAQLEECVRCIDPDEMFQLLTADGNPFKEEVIKNRMGKNRTTTEKTA